MAHRVVITGLGTVNPMGNSVDAFWEAIKAGRSGLGPITKFDTTEYATKIAGEVKDFNPSDYMDKREARKMEPFSHFAVASTLEAMRDADLKTGENIDPRRIGVILGVGIGGFQTIEDSYIALLQKGPSRVPPMTIPKLIANIGPANAAIAIQAHGPVYSMATACASAADAIGNSFRWIRDGMGDAMVTGGVEACITMLGVSGFNVIQALSTQFNDQPEKASRPFDKDRDGFVIAEGAGVVILESLEHAKARGATIYAELVGSGISCDANHLTAPHPEGRGAIEAMQMALYDAGIRAEDVDYINAHGTSTPYNDPAESQAIRDVFGENGRVMVSSTKSTTGHLLGAAAGLEAVISVMAIKEGIIPPTVNLENVDEDCRLNHVHEAREQDLNTVVSNSFGFGGHNVSLIFTRFAG